MQELELPMSSHVAIKNLQDLAVFSHSYGHLPVISGDFYGTYNPIYRMAITVWMYNPIMGYNYNYECESITSYKL